MPEIQKVKIAVNTSNGAVLEENNDRYLVGMDPASNDWLFSPDETIIGEFGVLLLLVDGIGKNTEGGFAAATVVQTIKKLFNQTLELPPDDEGIIRLLRKFFMVAHKQLIWEQENNFQLASPAASAAMILVRDHKLYCIWCGNTRIYRWSKRQLQGAYTYSSDHFECVSIDHNLGMQLDLYQNASKPKSAISDSKLIHFLGIKERDPGISSVILPFSKYDRVLLSTEGIFKSLDSAAIENAMSKKGEIENIAEDLITSAFNASAPFNISTVILELTEGLSFTNEKKLSETEILDNARLVFGPALELPELTQQEPQQSTFLKPGVKVKEKQKDPEITPMKVRTVLPEPETPLSDTLQSAQNFPDDLSQQSDQVKPHDQPVKPDELAPAQEESTDLTRGSEPAIPAESDALSKSQSSEIESPTNPLDDVASEKRSKLRIRMTVYPDQDPQDLSKEERTEKAKDHHAEPAPTEIDETDQIDETDTNDLSPESDFGLDISEEAIAMESEFPIQDQGFNDFEEEDNDYFDEEDGPDPYIEGDDEDQKNIDVSVEINSSENPDISYSDKEEYPVSEVGDERLPEDMEDDYEPEEMELEESARGDEKDELTDEEEIDETDPLESDEADKAMDDDLVLPFKKEVTIDRDWPFSEEDDEEIEMKHSAPLTEGAETISAKLEDPSAGDMADEDNVAESEEIVSESILNDKIEKHAQSGWTLIKSFWPYLLVLLTLFLLPLWICGKDSQIEIPEQGSTNADKPAKEVPEIPISEPEKKKDIAIEKTAPSKAAENETSVSPPVETKPAEKKPKEPEYDSQIQENKHQLIDEIKAMKRDKDALCKKVSTYQKNAPAGKQERLADLIESCDQLDKKFISIYDAKTGFLQTVRYDFLNGTIRNIKVSMEQLEKQLDNIRAETIQ